MRRTIAALMLVVALTAATKKPPADPKGAADRFQLDLAADEAAPEAPAPETPAADAPAPVASDKPAARYSVDTPIVELLTNFRSKAVLDKDMPGLSTDKNLDKFKGKSLRELAPLSGGRLSADLLEKVDKHLAAIK